MASEFYCDLCKDRLVYSDERKMHVHESTGSIVGEIQTPSGTQRHIALPMRAGCLEREEEDDN